MAEGVRPRRSAACARPPRSCATTRVRRVSKSRFVRAGMSVGSVSDWNSLDAKLHLHRCRPTTAVGSYPLSIVANRLRHSSRPGTDGNAHWRFHMDPPAEADSKMERSFRTEIPRSRNALNQSYHRERTLTKAAAGRP